MKILILTASLGQGGAETHIFELARALRGRGHELTIASAGGEIARRLKEENIRHIPLPLNSKRPSCLIYSFVSLRRLLKNESFDIVHLHSRIAALICRLALPKRNAPKVVSTVHAHFKTSPLLRRLSFWGQASAAVSEDLRNYLHTEYGISKEQIRVIPNAIDTDKFSKKIKKTTREAPKILFASRLDPDCSLGATLLCRIAPRLCEKYPHLSILIAGGGRAFSKISAMAKKVNEAVGYECIKLLGHVTDMPRLFSNADIFIGVSRAALEAMSSSLPVVLCGNEGFMGIVDAANVKEAEKTNFSCRDYELPDTIILQNAICSLLDMTNAERNKLGEYLREYVCRHHSLPTLGEDTEKLYDDTIKSEGFVVLCGYYGFGNLGDDILLCVAIDEMKKRYKYKQIAVICHDPKKIAEKFDVKTIRRENIPLVLKRIRQADRLVFGGGSILQDATSMRSLRFYALLIKTAAKNDVPVELLSNGLGPLKRKRARKIAKKSLSLCKSISFRDAESMSLALSLGIEKEKLSLTDDLSSHTRACDEEELCDIMGELSLDGKNFFLVALKGKTKRALRKIIEGEIKVQIALGLSPVFIAMHEREDKKLTRKLAKKHSAPCIEKITASALLALTNRSKLALGNRYHLLYLAKTQNTPIIPFGTDPKITSLK